MASRWNDVQRHLLRAGAPLLAAAVGESSPGSLSADSLTVVIPANRLALLGDPEQQRVLGGALMAVYGVRWRMVLRVATARIQAADAESTGEQGGERQRRYRAAEQHPLVRELIKRFEGDLIGRELIDLETWLARITAEQQAQPQRRFTGDLQDEGWGADA